MTTIHTYPSPLVQNQPGILTYSNPAVFAAPNDSYILKNVLGSIVSDTYVAPSTPMTVFVPSISSPVDVGYDNSGVLYVGTINTGTIYKVSSIGVITPFSVVSGYNFSTGLVFDSSNNLYIFRNFMSVTPQIIQIDTAGVQYIYCADLLLASSVFGLEIDNSGNIYVSNNTNNNILIIAPGGGVGSASVYYTGGLNDPHGIVFDNSGNLYVADSGNNRIAKIGPGGLSISTYATSPLFSGYIVGLVFDVFGNLYVTNNTTNKILKVFPNGSTTILFASSPLLNGPYGITIDTNGYLYIANSVGNNVLKMSTVTTPDTFTFPNVLIRTSGLNHLYIYDVTTGQLIASDIIIEISAICFKEGTKILCFIDKKEKYIPIEDIKEDTFVKIYKKNGKFEDQYKRAKTIIKGSILNAREHTMHKLYKLSKSKNPALIADLYVTGSHALLYDNLSNEEFEKMDELIERYNNYNIKFRDEDEYDEEYISDIKNMIKYYNDYKITLEDKYKLIAYFNTDFEEVTDNSICNIYHIVLENENKYENYGIYANGILAESTCEVSLTRFPGYEKINESNTVNNGIKKGFDINDKLNKYLIKQGQQDKLLRLPPTEFPRSPAPSASSRSKKITKQLIEHIEKIEDTVVKQIDTNTNTNTNIRKNYTYRKIPIKKNMTYKNKMSQK
jgi:sugar lactone lactonase YvrE